MNEQELQQKFQIFEQQIRQLQEQLRSVEEATYDMNFIKNGLDSLVGKVDTEIMAPLGKGIFVKAKLLSETLTVDVGAKNFVEKSIPETKELINNQLLKLKDVKIELESELNKLNSEITQTMMTHEASKKN